MPDTRPTFYGSFRESNAVALEILEPPLAAGVPIELDIYDGASPATMLATLEGARAKRWNPQLSDVGAGSAVINRHDPKATPEIIRRGNLAKVRIGGKYRGAWWLEDIDRSLVANGEKAAEDIKIAGRGEIAYLERAAMWTESYIGDDPIAGKWDLGEAGTGNALGDMLRRVLDEVLARPDGSPLPHLSLAWPYGSDSQGAAWDDTADLEPEVGANVLAVWQQLTALGLESEMTHELAMKTYRERGRHFEQPPTGNGSVTFLLGRHILGDWHERDRGGAVKTRVIVKGADNVTLVVSDPDAELDPYIGRRETSISVSSSSDPTTLQRAGEMTLAALRAEGEQLELPIAHDADPGGYQPYVHYRPGDYVAVERPGGDLETHRIVGLVFEEIPGSFRLTVQLNSIRVEALIRLKRMIDALGGGGTAAGSSSGSAISGGGSGGSGGGSGGGDGRVAAAAGDTPGYLYDQLVAGDGIAIALGGGGAAQHVEISATPGALGLGDLTDVDLTGATDGKVLKRAAGIWTPQTDNVGSGGGGSVAPLSADELHATWGDDFSAAALDAKWTRRNLPEPTMQAAGGSGLFVDIPNGPVDRQLHQAIGTLPEYLSVRLAVDEILAQGAAAMVGPYMVDAGGGGYGFSAYNDGNAYLWGLAGWTYSSTGPQISGFGPTSRQPGYPVWYELLRIASPGAGPVYLGRLSYNGKVWSPWSPPATAGTPTRIGLGRWYQSPSPHAFLAERFNATGLAIGTNRVRFPTSGSATYSADNEYSGAYTAALAADGTYASNGWARNGSANGQWWQVAWSVAQTIDLVTVRGRNAGGEHFGQGHLLFSDGTRYPLPQVNATGAANHMVVVRLPSPKTTTSLRLVAEYGATGNSGLSEVEAFLTS